MELQNEMGVVRREIVLAIERPQAWQLIADPRELETWLAGEVDLEIREGAEGVVRWPDGSERRAAIEEVEPQRRVSLSWWEPGEAASLVELTLDDVPGGTRLTVVEVPLAALRAVADTIVAGTRGAGGPQLAVAAHA